MKYNVQLKVYEGPLDLLYDMISKQIKTKNPNCGIK